MGELNYFITIYSNMNDNKGIGEKQKELESGPHSMLVECCKNNGQVLINCRNNHKLLGRLKAFDKHCNLILLDVKEMWTVRTSGQKPINKDRFIPKLFVRGDSVICVMIAPY